MVCLLILTNGTFQELSDVTPDNVTAADLGTVGVLTVGI